MSARGRSTGVGTAEGPSTACAHGASGRGCVTLSFVRSKGRTVLAAQVARTPLHVQGLLQGTGPWAEAALLNVAGGVLSGDALDVTVQAASGTRVRLRSVGATRLYRARGDTPARAALTLDSGPGACVIYLPDETIPYAGAVYEQHTTIHLAAGAHAIVGEVLAPGRQHHGEAFAYRRLDLRLSADLHVSAEGAGLPLIRERLVLEPARWPPSAAVLLGGSTHLASLYVCGPGADEALAGHLHELVRARGLHGGATSGWRDVVLLRAVGASAHGLLALLREAAAASCARMDARFCE